jgi:glycosyltransferase involved in cell wall biosynthesis
MLSAIIITKNEEQMIVECLKSLDFVDEMLVIDNGSIDRTDHLAQKQGAEIFKSDATDYSQLREFGLRCAKGDWVLYIDADERVSLELKQEIITTIKTSSASVFALPRTNYYLGIPMHYGGWGGDYVIRLFRRPALFGWQGELHEQPKFIGNLQKLSQPLIHYSHRDLSSMVNKTLNFTAFEANLRLAAHHPPVTWWRFFRVMLTEFWYRFVILSAWRDGPEGIIDGLFQVFNTFIIYARLWELQYESRRL